MMRSLLPNPEVLRVGYLGDLLSANVHSAFHPFGAGKMSTSIHGPL